MLPRFQKVVSCIILVLLIFSNYYGSTEAFDVMLDTAKNTRWWQLGGSFVYANSTSDEQIKALAPKRLTATLNTKEFRREGVWYIKHNPDGNNVWNVKYSLNHLLFVQGWLTYLASPSVPIVIKTSGDKEVGRFWSDGKSWCDAVFKINLHNFFHAEMNASMPGDYAMIDKIVMGVMSNITSLRNQQLNPCLTSPMISEDDRPDMEIHEQVTTNEYRRRVPDEGPPDMKVTHRSNMTRQGISHPIPTAASSMIEATSTETTLRTYKTETGGATCNCVCSCSKPNNTTNTSTTKIPTTF